MESQLCTCNSWKNHVMPCKKRKMPRLGSNRKSLGSQKYVPARIDRAPRKTFYGPKANRNVKRNTRTMKAAGGHPACTKKYAASLIDPSGEYSKGACLPAGFPMPSQKIRVFARGFMSTGTTGDGVIYYAPQLANDVQFLLFTTAASVGTAATAFSAFTGKDATTRLTKIPYSNASLTGQTVEGRLVSACLRVRYAGTEDARSGVVSLFEDPDHLAVDGLTTNGISAFDSCGKQRVYGDGAWHQINWSGPCKQAEQEYISTAFYSNYCLCIAISGTTSAGVLGPAPFEWEVWENLEYIGRDAVGKTNNMLDEAGTKDVVSKVKVVQSASDPLNPTSGAQVLRDILKPKAGGTLVGNALQAGMSSIHPGVGGVWSGIRSFFNGTYRTRGSRRA